jgi:two-component system chemotaxis response regulator CheY
MKPGELPAPRVLLVDDDELVLAVLHTALVRAGYSVRDALNSAEALRMLRIHPVDLLVLDAHMDGSTLETDLAAISALVDAPTVIVLSGAAVDAGLLASVGASYLAKPVDAVVFLERVATAVETA